MSGQFNKGQFGHGKGGYMFRFGNIGYIQFCAGAGLFVIVDGAVVIIAGVVGIVEGIV